MRPALTAINEPAPDLAVDEARGRIVPATSSALFKLLACPGLRLFVQPSEPAR